MSEGVDVVVVGARCAGSPLATRLARAGVRVCLVDKARFPSDTASTHIIQPRGTDALQRLGVLAAARSAGATDIDGVVLQYADARLETRYPAAAADHGFSGSGTRGLSLRRRSLDAVLLEAAAAAGVQVRTRSSVTGVLHDRDGRVCGVRTTGGDLRARIVIGADGRSSSIARAVGAREYAGYPAPRLAVWRYYAGARPDGNRLRIARIGRTALIATPADDDLLLVGVVPSVRGRETFLADRDAAFDTELRRSPELCAIVEDATQVGPMRVVPDWRAYFRESAGPGWVLTGDAGHFKDPAAAQGITDALIQAERLADTVISGLDATGDVDQATRRWWRWRDDDCWDMHWFARDMGRDGPTTPIMTEVVREVANTDPMLLARVLNRDLPSTAIVSPARVALAAGYALGRRSTAAPTLVREATVTGKDRLARGAAAARRQLIWASAATRRRSLGSGALVDNHD